MLIGADAAAEDAHRAGFYVSWLCLDESGRYQCAMRRLSDQPFMKNGRRTVYVRRGKGATLEAAIRDAMQDDFLDILG